MAEENKITAMKMINGLLAKSYKEAWEAKEKGIPVGWSTSVFPQEIVECFGLPLLYPENQAAGVAAKKESLSLQEKAESRGYSIDLKISICLSRILCVVAIIFVMKL